eukprot:808095_1
MAAEPSQSKNKFHIRHIELPKLSSKGRSRFKSCPAVVCLNSEEVEINREMMDCDFISSSRHAIFRRVGSTVTLSDKPGNNGGLAVCSAGAGGFMRVREHKLTPGDKIIFGCLSRDEYDKPVKACALRNAHFAYEFREGDPPPEVLGKRLEFVPPTGSTSSSSSNGSGRRATEPFGSPGTGGLPVGVGGGHPVGVSVVDFEAIQRKIEASEQFHQQSLLAMRKEMLEREKKHEEVVKLMMKSSASMEDIKAQVEKSTELSEQSNQMAAEQRKSNEELQQTLKQQQSELASRSLKDAEESKRREEELMKRVEEANRRAEEANRRAEEAARKAKEAEEKHEEAKQNELAAKQLLESQKAKSAEEVAALEKKQSEHLEALQKQKADAEQKGAAESAKVAEKLSAEIESLKNTQKSELSALKSENRRKTRKRRNDAREAAAKAMRAYHENLKKHLDQQAESLNCSICYETFRDPRSLNCMHSFCRVCIEGWFRKQRTCPNCRQKCHRKDLHKNQVVFDSIEQFEKQSAELEQMMQQTPSMPDGFDEDSDDISDDENIPKNNNSNKRLPGDLENKKRKKRKVPKRMTVDDWRIGEVSVWLRSLPFGADYEATFMENDVDGRMLFELDDAILQSELGIAIASHRKEILNAIVKLSEEALAQESQDMDESDDSVDLAAELRAHLSTMELNARSLEALRAVLAHKVAACSVEGKGAVESLRKLSDLSEVFFEWAPRLGAIATGTRFFRMYSGDIAAAWVTVLLDPQLSTVERKSFGDIINTKLKGIDQNMKLAIVHACETGWDSPDLQRSLQAPAGSPPQPLPAESDLVSEARIEILVNQKRWTECLNYLTSIGKLARKCVVLEAADRRNEGVELACSQLNAPNALPFLTRLQAASASFAFEIVLFYLSQNRTQNDLKFARTLVDLVPSADLLDTQRLCQVLSEAVKPIDEAGQLLDQMLQANLSGVAVEFGFQGVQKLFSGRKVMSPSVWQFITKVIDTTVGHSRPQLSRLVKLLSTLVPTIPPKSLIRPLKHLVSIGCLSEAVDLGNVLVNHENVEVPCILVPALLNLDHSTALRATNGALWRFCLSAIISRPTASNYEKWCKMTEQERKLASPQLLKMLRSTKPPQWTGDLVKIAIGEKCFDLASDMISNAKVTLSQLEELSDVLCILRGLLTMAKKSYSKLVVLEPILRKIMLTSFFRSVNEGRDPNNDAAQRVTQDIINELSKFTPKYTVMIYTNMVRAVIGSLPAAFPPKYVPGLKVWINVLRLECEKAKKMKEYYQLRSNYPQLIWLFDG